MMLSFEDRADRVAELRIIAKDVPLALRDRVAIVGAAEELELAQRSVAFWYAKYLEATQEMMALRERVHLPQSQHVSLFPFVSMGFSATVPLPNMGSRS
jgi:hypothetical protein